MYLEDYENFKKHFAANAPIWIAAGKGFDHVTREAQTWAHDRGSPQLTPTQDDELWECWLELVAEYQEANRED